MTVDMNRAATPEATTENTEKKTVYALYNPCAGNNMGRERAEAVKQFYDGAEVILKNLCEFGDYADFLRTLTDADTLVICGGDGTLNRFINETEGLDCPAALYYFGTGTGNDFLRDLGKDGGGEPVPVNRYIRNLPRVTVKGKTYRFLNNVGFGIDGYCCEVGDRLRAEGNSDINYTAIAIKGLLFHYRPTGATVIVDGREYHYRKVWLAPTMNGRYYGGGMMPTPDQDRLSPDRTVSLMLMYGTGKLHTLMIFPSIFKGEHIKKKKAVAIHSGHSITVTFDSPRALQIDGETILDVTTYTVESDRTAD